MCWGDECVKLNLLFHPLFTAHAGHASELVKTTNLSEWYGIIIVSGDGLIFEV